MALEDVDKLGYMGWQIDQAADPQKVKCTHILASFPASIPSWVWRLRTNSASLMELST